MAGGTKTFMNLMSSMAIGAKGMSNNDNSKWANFNDDDAASYTTFWSSQKILDEAGTSVSFDGGVY